MAIDTDVLGRADASAVGTWRALADPLRWRIVQLLAGEELCGCHLVDELGAGQSLVSHHVKVLRDAGLVAASRHRYWTYYRLRPEALAAAGHVLADLGADAPAPGSTRRPCC